MPLPRRRAYRPYQRRAPSGNKTAFFVAAVCNTAPIIRLAVYAPDACAGLHQQSTCGTGPGRHLTAGCHVVSDGIA